MQKHMYTQVYTQKQVLILRYTGICAHTSIHTYRHMYIYADMYAHIHTHGHNC